MDTFHLYQDIQARTEGEIYIGVVGPGANRKIHVCPSLYGAACSAAYEKRKQSGIKR